MELLESDLYSLEEFFARIDLLTSVATQEGFGRPLAAALLAGVPCLLLDRTVFREFFDPGASFFPDPHAVVQALRAVAIDQNLSAVTFRPPRKAVDAYTAAIDNLIRAGGAAT
jgi:glycosyltransferase involved in cell wall biosynthesis